nr:Chain I, Breast cancer type 2 susceptibility protein [Homo sapiens]8R2G_J Chain J, Breast cancer type 2 susceptibility protein [Homo sapiens]8R2G_K Chain K, Breast cancer type 2 susceptibility protein [Homo sapiens]8R2G_L Chain L, Breast cancer type 2 susceptibility protein [Homo sapiens]8R2G_M Chain M, Breast cancer type 2 susceptibility protein [Homo sapiens]8R2G_N Chain N, Breast cancer type 2 susceptibility protein [Homo sapiens]8R2G_O Chain O, Breast cancer type 2 susceptibility prote
GRPTKVFVPPFKTK